jgi:hypothetical protein
MPKKTQHVVPNADGGWSVKKGGSARATKTFDKQKDAIIEAKRISKNQGAELYIHRKDGTIREKNSYGNDPCPPLDKR